MESIPHMAARPARDILPRRVVGSGRERLDLKPARTGSTGHSAKSVTHQEKDALQATTTDGEQISAPPIHATASTALHRAWHGVAYASHGNIDWRHMSRQAICALPLTWSVR